MEAKPPIPPVPGGFALKQNWRARAFDVGAPAAPFSGHYGRIEIKAVVTAFSVKAKGVTAEIMVNAGIVDSGPINPKKPSPHSHP